MNLNLNLMVNLKPILMINIKKEIQKTNTTKLKEPDNCMNANQVEPGTLKHWNTMFGLTE